jgi:acetoin utilization protein AcuB
MLPFKGGKRVYVRDIMTTNVVTIPSNTNILKARRFMSSHGFRRLPVVDKGELVGIVTADRLEKVAPPEATGDRIWELTYSLGSLYRTHVKQVMRKDVVTATPDMTIEEALALAQAKKVGAMIVVDDGKVVGIVTTNDFFYRIVNRVLGLGEPGTRIEVAGGGECRAMEEIISTINRLGLKIITLLIMAVPRAAKKDIVVHIDSDDVTQLITELKAKGYKVGIRKR